MMTIDVDKGAVRRGLHAIDLLENVIAPMLRTGKLTCARPDDVATLLASIVEFGDDYRWQDRANDRPT